MRFNYTQIKQLLEDEWDELTKQSDADHWLTEIADGLVPIYHGEIIADWAEMPSEYDDNWKEQYGEAIPKEVGITALMATDLYEYYRSTTYEIYRELLKKKEDN